MKAEARPTPLAIHCQCYRGLVPLLTTKLKDTFNHWEIDYRKIIGIYRNFDGELLHSYFTTVSEMFLELL